MIVWTASIVTILIVSIVAARFRAKNVDYQLNHIAAQLDVHLNSRKQYSQTGFRLLRRIYSLINISINNANDAQTYKAIDLLKLAYGSGLFRPNEHQCLGSVILAAFRNRQPDAAAIVMAAFRPLMRNISTLELAALIDQLALIAVLAYRFKYTFILSKVLETVCDIAARPEVMQDKSAMTAILRAIRLIGLFALRRKEYELFQELSTRFKTLCYGAGREIEDIEWLFIAWLHHLGKSGDEDGVMLVTKLGQELFCNHGISSDAVAVIITESSKTAGIASLSQQNKVPPLILNFNLELADKSSDPLLWRTAVSAAGQVLSIVISRRGIGESIAVLEPLLENGRILMTGELLFGEFTDDFRQKKLFTILRECLILAELKARQDMTRSPAEIIIDIYQYWTGLAEATGRHKSIKKFCQLLLLYWQSVRKRQARRSMPNSSCLSTPILFSDKDRKRLGL